MHVLSHDAIKEELHMPWKASIQSQVGGMNISTGGSAIRYQPVKVAKANKPLLVIGLGGTGLRIGRQIKDMFIERFIPATLPTPGLDERLPAHTRFLGIDTDEEDLKKLGYQGDEYCTIGDPNIASKLTAANRHLLPAYISEWLNPNLVSHGGNGVDGAQGVRQIGRFDLFTNVIKVTDAIRVALNQVMPGQGNIQVVIAAGVAGGTGAGTFMDMPYLVRHVAKQLSLTSRVSIMGILVTPDVYAAMDGTTAGIKRANGYAGLKELDYWMENVDRRDSFEQQYAPNLTVKWDDPPFDDCILVSGQTVSGGAPAAAYDTLRGVVAEYITNMFADEKRDQTALMDATKDYGFSYSSYRSNVRANLAPQPKKFDVSRRYTVIGASNGQIPLQEMILTEAVFLFNKVKEYYDVTRTPDMYAGTEYADFVQKIVGNCVSELLAPISIKSPRDVAITQIRNSDHLAPHSSDNDATVKGYYNALESRAMGSEALELIADRVRMLEQQLVAMFVDPEKGPYYASRYIDATPGEYVPAEGEFEVAMPHNFNLKKTLEGLRSAALTRRTQAHNDYTHQVKLATTEYQEIRTNLIPPMQNGPTAKRYYTACESANLNKREYWRQDTLYRLYDALIAKVDEISTQIFKPLCKTMLELTKVYKEIETYMSTPAYQLSRQGYYSDIVDPVMLVNHFKNEYMSPTRINDMVSTLLKDMMRPYTYDPATKKYEAVDSKECWLVTDPHHGTTVGVNVRDNLQRVLNDFFRPFNSNTLLEFWKLQYPTSINPDGTLNLPAIVATLGPVMTSAAAPMFLPDSVYPLSGGDAVTLRSEYITVPQNAMGLAAALGANQLKQVKESTLSDRIFWIRSLDGVSLYHYGALHTCEADYVQYAIQGSHPGSHLWEGAKMNWKNLPNPLPRGARPTGYSNAVQLAADDAAIARIDALIAAGKITVDNLNNNLNLSFNTQLTRDHAQVLLADLQAKAVTPEAAKARYAQVLATRESLQMTIEASILTNYGTKYAGQDPQKQLIYDMMMQRPAMLDTMEKDIAELAELDKAIKSCVSEGDSKTKILGMAARMADLFAFGILTRPTPMHVNYTMDGAAPQTVYNTMKDNAKYAVRYHAAYANEVCVAAKLMDMEDPNHEEYGKMVQLKMLEDALANDLEGAVMELLTIRLTAFGANAQPLKTKLAAARSAMLLASPMTLKMNAADKQLCLDFLDGMIAALDARAMGFGMMLV